MKNYFKYLTLLLLFFSCSEEEVKTYTVLEEEYYKTQTFVSTNKSIDINNDGAVNTNILHELTNYSTYPYDLEVQLSNQDVLFSFYLPTQYIDFECCPSGSVEFARGGFMLSLDNKTDIVENLEIGNGVEVKYFGKTSEQNYKLILTLNYYDFSVSGYITTEFEINYNYIETIKGR